MNIAGTRSAVQAGVANPGWGDQSSDRLGYDEKHDMSIAEPQSAVPNPSIHWFHLARTG